MQQGSLAGTPSTGRTLPTRRSGVSPFLGTPLRIARPVDPDPRHGQSSKLSGRPRVASARASFCSFCALSLGSGRASHATAEIRPPTRKRATWAEIALQSNPSARRPGARSLATGARGGVAFGWVAPSTRLRDPGRFAGISRRRRRTGGSNASQRNRGIRQKFSPRARWVRPGGCLSPHARKAGWAIPARGNRHFTGGRGSSAGSGGPTRTVPCDGPGNVPCRTAVRSRRGGAKHPSLRFRRTWRPLGRRA